MKKLFLISVSAIMLSTFAAGVARADWGDQYLMAKVGVMFLDINDADDLMTVGLIYGFGVSETITLEGEYNTTVSGGEYDIGTDEGEFSVWTLAAYGVYRHSFTDAIYLKAKLGILHEDVERDGLLINESASDTGGAGGLGLGFVVGESLTVEAEYTVVEEDVQFFNVGLHYAF